MAEDFKELVRILAVAVRHQLVCPECRNMRGGEDECRTCHGDHPNSHLIARIDEKLARVEHA